MRFRGIIFDCDGVLIMNTNQIYDEALTSAVYTFKPDVPEEDIRDLMNSTRGKTFTHQLQQLLGSNHSRLDDAVQHYEQYIHREDIFQRINLLDGMSEVLFQLKRKGFVLAMATGMNPSLLDRLFREDILPSVFEHVARVHDIKNPLFQKPHPKILLDLLKTLQLPAEGTAYIGDTQDDITMAKEAGLYAVSVLTGRLDKTQATALGSNLVLPSAVEILKWI